MARKYDEEQREGYIDKELQKQRGAGRKKKWKGQAWRRGHMREVLTRQSRSRGNLWPLRAVLPAHSPSLMSSSRILKLLLWDTGRRQCSLLSTAGLFLLLLCSSHLSTAVGMKVWPPFKCFSECSPEWGREEKPYEKWLKLKTQQSVHYGWLAIFFSSSHCYRSLSAF